MKKIAICLTILLLAHCLCMGQTVLFNAGSSVYALQDGTCNYTALIITFPNCADCIPFSIARFKDTLYILTSASIGLYWIDLKSPGIANPVQNWPTNLLTNNLTCDKNGLLYYVGYYDMLSRFNPHTGKVEDLGVVPYPPAGDLTFYNGKLLVAAYDGIDLYADPRSFCCLRRSVSHSAQLLPGEWVHRHPGLYRDASP